MTRSAPGSSRRGSTGEPLETALAWGNAGGAAAVAAEGDQTGLPTRAELARLLAAGGPDTLR